MNKHTFYCHQSNDTKYDVVSGRLCWTLVTGKKKNVLTGKKKFYYYENTFTFIDPLKGIQDCPGDPGL